MLILRNSVKIIFPEKDEKSNPETPLESGGFALWYKRYDLTINKRILYPFLDVILLISMLVFGGVLLLISVLNIILVIASVIAFWKFIKKLAEKPNSSKEGYYGF